MNHWLEVKKLSDQGRWQESKRIRFIYYPVCECCGKRPAKDLHHVFLGRRSKASVAVQKFINSIFNQQGVCGICHDGKAKSYENRQNYGKKLLERWGKEIIHAWLDSAPDEIRLNDRYKETCLIFGKE